MSAIESSALSASRAVGAPYATRTCSSGALLPAFRRRVLPSWQSCPLAWCPAFTWKSLTSTNSVSRSSATCSSVLVSVKTPASTWLDFLPSATLARSSSATTQDLLHDLVVFSHSATRNREVKAGFLADIEFRPMYWQGSWPWSCRKKTLSDCRGRAALVGLRNSRVICRTTAVFVSHLGAAAIKLPATARDSPSTTGLNISFFTYLLDLTWSSFTAGREEDPGIALAPRPPDYRHGSLGCRKMIFRSPSPVTVNSQRITAPAPAATGSKSISGVPSLCLNRTGEEPDQRAKPRVKSQKLELEARASEAEARK